MSKLMDGDLDLLYHNISGADVVGINIGTLRYLIDRLRDAERRLQVTVDLGEWHYDRDGEPVMYCEFVEKAIKKAGFQIKEEK